MQWGNKPKTAMPLGVAIFGFPSQMLSQDAKIGNDIFDCSTVNYGNLPTRTLHLCPVKKVYASASRFLYT